MAIIIHLLSLHSSQNSDSPLMVRKEKTKLIILNLSVKAIAPFAAVFQVQCQLL